MSHQQGETSGHPTEKLLSTLDMVFPSFEIEQDTRTLTLKGMTCDMLSLATQEDRYDGDEFALIHLVHVQPLAVCARRCKDELDYVLMRLIDHGGLVPKTKLKISAPKESVMDTPEEVDLREGLLLPRGGPAKADGASLIRERLERNVLSRFASERVRKFMEEA